MIVIRLVLLGILFYVALLLLRGIFNFRKKKKGTGQEQAAGNNAQVKDVLVEDPVCHTLVPKHQAIRMRVEDRTLYFCSDACCDKYSEKARKEK